MLMSSVFLDAGLTGSGCIIEDSESLDLRDLNLLLPFKQQKTGKTDEFEMLLMIKAFSAQCRNVLCSLHAMGIFDGLKIFSHHSKLKACQDVLSIDPVSLLRFVMKLDKMSYLLFVDFSSYYPKMFLM